jgi:membrane associated rhomboid family serine protease
MFENRGYAGERMARPFTPVTWTLLAVNAAVFLFQYYALPVLAPDYFAADKFEDTFALSLDGLRAGHLWQLLTYQFMHGSLLHIFANSWAIVVFGRVVETTLGKWRMLAVYFLSGVAGGLLQMLGSWAWPRLFGDAAIIGASAGAYGLVAAFVTLFPRQRLLMLLFFVLPISMRARTLLRVSVTFSVIGIFYPFLLPFVHRHLTLAHYVDSLFMGIGHAAHLGGMAAGVLMTLWIRRGLRMRPVVEISPKSSLNITHAPD